MSETARSKPEMTPESDPLRWEITQRLGTAIHVKPGSFPGTSGEANFLRRVLDYYDAAKDAEAEGFRRGVQAAADCLPGNWLDPLLTGDDKVIHVSPGPEIEAYTRALIRRIRALRPEGEKT